MTGCDEAGWPLRDGPEGDAKTMSHTFGPDDKCVACGKTACSDAFWARLGAPPGTRGLRLRPGMAPAFIRVGET